MSIPVERRLRRLTRKNEETGCREWIGFKSHLGYGRMMYEGKSMSAHRVAFMEFVGAIPDGMHVLHRCDNRACVNPDHLFLGTHSDNMSDMKNKGRRRGVGGRPGEKHPLAKLTDDQVREMRSLGLGCAEAAARYGIARSTASRIINNLGWRSVK